MDAVASFDGPCRAGEISGKVADVVGYSLLRTYLGELVATGAIQRQGHKASTVYLPTGRIFPSKEELPARVREVSPSRPDASIDAAVRSLSADGEAQTAPERAADRPAASATPWRTGAAAHRVTGRPTKDAADLANSAAAAERRVGLLPAVLEQLAAGPKSFGQLCEALRVRRSELSPITAQLLESGRIVNRGITATAPYVLTNAVPPPVKTIAPPPAPDPHALRQKLQQILATGASYDIPDLVRNCRGTFPSVQDLEVAGVIDEFMSAGAVERVIGVGSRPRFRSQPVKASA